MESRGGAGRKAKTTTATTTLAATIPARTAARRGTARQRPPRAAIARGGGRRRRRPTRSLRYSDRPGVPMFRLGRAISVALRVLIAVDAAVSSNDDLREAWAMYKDVVMEWWMVSDVLSICS